MRGSSLCYAMYASQLPHQVQSVMPSGASSSGQQPITNARDFLMQPVQILYYGERVTGLLFLPIKCLVLEQRSSLAAGPVRTRACSGGWRLQNPNSPRYHLWFLFRLKEVPAAGLPPPVTAVALPLCLPEPIAAFLSEGKDLHIGIRCEPFRSPSSCLAEGQAVAPCRPSSRDLTPAADTGR